MAHEAESPGLLLKRAASAVHTASVMVGLVMAAALWLVAASSVVLLSFLDGWMTSPGYKVLAGLFVLLPTGMGAWVWFQGRGKARPRWPSRVSSRSS